jgi:hypothetical protein
MYRSPTVTHLANGVQIVNCHSLPAAIEVTNSTQLANCHAARYFPFSFLSSNSFFLFADHISLVIIRRGNPLISRQSRPQVAGAVNEW